MLTFIHHSHSDSTTLKRVYHTSVNDHELTLCKAHDARHLARYWTQPSRRSYLPRCLNSAATWASARPSFLLSSFIDTICLDDSRSYSSTISLLYHIGRHPRTVFGSAHLCPGSHSYTQVTGELFQSFFKPLSRSSQRISPLYRPPTPLHWSTWAFIASVLCCRSERLVQQ